MTPPLSEKPLSERIAERFGLKKTSVSAKNRAAFLVLREDIKQALNEGWKSKHIWETLFDEGKITFSYPTFHNYVKKLIQPSMGNAAKPEAETIGVLKEQKDVAVASQTKPPRMQSFTYNPIANKEDLI